MSAIDRTGWGSGPWDDEPDQLEWMTAVGYLGFINRAYITGALNGYVAVPRGHPVYGVSYKSCPPLEVHDGVTFAEPAPPGRDPKPDEDLWWLGFMSGGLFYFMPAMRGIHSKLGLQYPKLLDDARLYRTLEFIKLEAESLASQLAALARGVPS